MNIHVHNTVGNVVVRITPIVLLQLFNISTLCSWHYKKVWFLLQNKFPLSLDSASHSETRTASQITIRHPSSHSINYPSWYCLDRNILLHAHHAGLILKLCKVLSDLVHPLRRKYRQTPGWTGWFLIPQLCILMLQT